MLSVNALFRCIAGVALVAAVTAAVSPAPSAAADLPPDSVAALDDLADEAIAGFQALVAAGPVVNESETAALQECPFLPDAALEQLIVEHVSPGDEVDLFAAVSRQPRVSVNGDPDDSLCGNRGSRRVGPHRRVPQRSDAPR